MALWPRTYGTEATFVLDGDAHVGNPVSLAGRIEAALLEREELTAAAMELPPELRSPDPIGRLRAGIRVQSRGALGYVVEFRGSDPQSVQRIANRLVDRAIALVPKLSVSPADRGPEVELAARTRAVTEFLTAHPEMTLEQASGKPSTSDSGLEALRTEKRQIELRLGTGATDNPYAEPGQDPELLNRRLTELKLTIARREAALKQPRPASPPAVAPELTSQWRALLADLATAQAHASAPSAQTAATAHVTARASLPTSPLTPNRLVLSIVAALLSLAAAMIAYVLPRKPEPARRQVPRPTAPGRSEPPAPRPASDPPPGLAAATAQRSDPPAQRSDPPRGSGSEPPGPIAVQRTVVLAAPSGSSPPLAVEAKRSQTDPGGLQAPQETSPALADTALAAPRPQAPPAAALFGSRPPPGAGSYSVSSSHPPPVDARGGARTSVERLSPLHSAHPPAQSSAPASRRPSPTERGDGHMPQIMSRPPALDPEAERWAARFETLPPPAEAPEEAPRKRSGRWKTQVMGSMVPIEVLAAREERPPMSEVDSYRPQPAAAAAAPTPAASTSIYHDVPTGWRPNVDPTAPPVVALRDAIVKETGGRRICIAVTGARGPERAQVASGLALALSQVGARVLLMEGDFDRPEIHQVLAINPPPGAGFSQQLLARKQNGQPRPWVVVRCSPNLEVLAEGRMRSPGLNASDEFQRAVQELLEQHHVVIIQAPALDKPDELRRISPLAQAVVAATPSQAPTIQFGDNALRALL